jgi:hypothetical protein
MGRNLTLIKMAIKKCVAMRLGVINESRTTNRKQRGLPVKALSPTALLLVAWESHMTPSWQEYTKTPPETRESTYFFTDKSPKRAFL